MIFKKIFFILFLATTTILFGQQNNKADTLLLFDKKYPIIKTPKYLSSALAFPFKVFTCEYKPTGKSFEYEKIKEDACIGSNGFDENGAMYDLSICSGKEIIYSNLTNFVDSISVDLNNFDYSNIKIKSGAKSIEINRLQYKAYYDSTSLTVEIDMTGMDRKTLGKLLTSNGKKPKRITLDALFYVDEKASISYYLPCEFIIKSK